MSFEAYSVGVCHASVCTNLSIPEAEQKLNDTEPTGLASRWSLSEDKFFKCGKIANGSDCPDTPGNKHYLMSC